MTTATATPSATAAPAPRPVAGLKHYADFFDADARMVADCFINPGYHSKVPTGTQVHDIRASFTYALELLEENAEASDRLAFKILNKVLPLQDTDPVSKTYGLWSWHYEEPLAQMDPPDWNWADFCGCRVGQALIAGGSRMPVALREQARAALCHAAGSIYRRNMGPHYTNISIMGGIVTALAGEVLGEPRMLAYGARRLRQAVEHFRAQGGFNEYNSPTYTRVVLYDCADALACLRDERARESAGFLFECAWEIVANHFHPATGQWCGPHSRDYGLFLLPEVTAYLSTKTGVQMEPHPLAQCKSFETARHADPAHSPCPQRLRGRFMRLPQPEVEFTETYERCRAGVDDIAGTVWMNEEACLGSVNHEFMWDQRRVLLGYWNGAEGSAVALRLRFMRDGREFASAYVRNHQRGPRVLSALHLMTGRGTFHPEWGTAPDDVFDAEDFRMRYELTGLGVDARENGDGSFTLFSGAWGAVVRPAACRFGDAPVRWEITRGEAWVAIDGVCHAGERREFPFREFGPVALGAVVELARNKTAVASAPVQVRPDGALRHFSHEGLSVSVPDRAVPFPR
jgi:hypothetical protein